MFEFLFDLKCSVTTAILTVLIYLLIMNILQRGYPGQKFSDSIDNTDWYKSLEILMLVSVFIAYNINLHLFTCKSY